MTTEMMTIRKMCEAFDVTPRTLRFYEAKELIFPTRVGSRRLYAKSDRARLKLILRGKRFGFSLEDIRRLLDLYNQEGGQKLQLSKSYELARERLSQMEHQRLELDATIAELKEQMAWGEEALATMRQSAAE